MTIAAKIIVCQHSSSSYGPRTYANAKGAQLTVAFAADLHTAGEKLTHKAAGDAYVPIPLTMDRIDAARRLFSAMRRCNVQTLNVAGNGIYTLSKHGWSQRAIDEYVYDVIALAHKHWPLVKIRSGAQTGVDLSGLSVGHALGIEVEGLLPKGFRQRFTNGVDVNQTQAAVIGQIILGAEHLVARISVEYQEGYAAEAEGCKPA